MKLYRLINEDCLSFLRFNVTRWDTVFADPPDNIGQKYEGYEDKMPDSKYVTQLSLWLARFVAVADTVWFSFNAKWWKHVAGIVNALNAVYPNIEDKFCVQTFTFGQHNKHDLGNNYRPLLRLRVPDAPLFPDAIRVESSRQKMGDKRANPDGRVPGDVFDFPRVVGNSRQRRKWHKTQLNEGLVRRCLRLTTPAGGSVLDPFAGTGTTMRVAMREGMECDMTEISLAYCNEIAADNGLKPASGYPGRWSRALTGEIEDLPLLGGEQDRRVQ